MSTSDSQKLQSQVIRQRGIKVGDGTKLANHLTLKQGVYIGLSASAQSNPTGFKWNTEAEEREKKDGTMKGMWANVDGLTNNLGHGRKWKGGRKERKDGEGEDGVNG